jgi:hypothetical protein
MVDPPDSVCDCELAMLGKIATTAAIENWRISLRTFALRGL